MADLDDFFAKKDRKKSKSVKKFTTADEIAKKLEDTKQKPDVRPKKERPVQDGEEGTRPGEEEEWKEYEEPVKDYTGLKIQVLAGGANAQESGRDSSSEDTAPDSTKTKGPWNKPVESEQAAGPAAPEEPAAPAARKAYVPPTARHQAQPTRRVQAKHAPDINSDVYFPSLGTKSSGRAGWSTAGGPAPPRAAPPRAPLALGNRFTDLADVDS